jgi:gliding motility-associated-like protein
MVVQTPPDAGNDGALTLCISSPASGLFAALGGSPDAGGTWTGPSAVVGGQFNPATMNVGDYTYTVAGVSPCPADVATVSVAVLATPDAGSPGNVSLCSSDAAINLFAQLGGTPDAGGTWTGPSAVVGGQFDPATMTAGVYTYTINVPPPCVNVSSTVTVAVQAPPFAGIDGALTLCISSPASGLFEALGGTPDVGGMWNGPSAVTGGSFNPATMSAGDYTYTVAGVSPCPADVATVSVAVLATPDAGSPGNVSLCSSDAAINLFAQLGGTPDAGGAWTGPSAVTGGSFDPASMTAGVYMYTITVPPPCVNVSSSVTVAVQAPPNAGSDGALTLCISSPASDLFAALGGTPDAAGSWSGPSAITGGSFDPSTMSAGDYVYTVAGIAPCPADVATVSVAVLATPYAGSPGNISLCSSDAAINLFAQLGGSPDAGGAWTGPSVVVGGQFDPASMTAGVYTYTITVPPPCVNVSSTVTVAVQAPPFAGSDGSLTLCISSPTSDLFTALNGSPDAGGTWAGPSAITGGSFDPSTMSAGDYVYTVAGVSPCLADVATVSVAVLATPDAGSPGNISLCSSDAAINLFAQLGGSPDAGGAWTGPSVVVGGQFDPASMTAGVYTYTITVPPPCVNVSSTVTVAVQAPPFAGSDGSLTLCISSPTSDLFTALDGSPDAGGTWSGPSLITGGSFDPATMSAGDYVYTVEGTSPCPADVATVSVAVSTAPDPGDDDILNLCASGDPVDLFQALNGADLGGSWTNPSNGSFGGTFIPGTSATGNYTYTIPGIAPCPSVSAVIAVNVVSNADAGGNGSISLCSSANAISLFTLLQGTPDAGGDWLAPDGTAFSGTLNAQSEMAGTYTYVVVVPSPCVNDTAQVQVGVTLAVDAGIDSSITLCSSNPPIDLLAQLGGSPDESGTWSGPGGPSSSSFNPSYSAPGAYTFTVQGTAPCPNATATVTIAVNPMPNAGTDGTLSLCPEAAPANMFASLGGNPDLGGTWTTPGGIPHGNMFDPALDPTGAYTYTVSGTAPCLNDNSTATVNIYFVPAPNAGNDAVSCTFDGLLNATGTWISGHWSGPSGTSIMHSDSASTTVSANTGGAYNFIWSTESAQGCASSDTVRITFTDTITPSVETLETLCNGTCDGTAMATAVGGNLDSSAYVFQWSGGTGGNASTGAGFCAGNYTATALDTNGCAGSIDFTITEPEPLAIDTITSTDALCPGSCDGTILITDPEGTDFSIDNGTTFQSAVSFSGICPGGYSVIMLNANGCSATGTAIVGSAEPVVAGFSLHPDTLFVNATSAAFTNVSSGNATEFLWDFGDGETSTEANPVHVFPAGIAEVYEICLTAMTAANCPDTYCVPLPILDLPAIFLPNAFTPDGDGLNDVFRVSGFGITAHDFHFMIFNRWGAKIFDTTDPSAAWDGKLNGSVVKSDVYVWKVTATFFNTIEPYEATGHVTLLK